MIRTAPDRATSVEPIPVQGLDANAVVACEFDARGRLRGISVKAAPPPAETPDERAARDLASVIGHKLRHIGDLAEALRRARVAVAFLEDLVAIEEMRGPDARALLLAPPPAGRAP